eukprot:snap_masked-scaffold_34-processed-gene-3.25-mRNA-1 protein AED:1.00 eAED:1.00 QI:0/-1/0/0/-1/1/1/0/427
MGQIASQECALELSQCGGSNFTGLTDCCDSLICVEKNETWFECEPEPFPDPTFDPLEECGTELIQDVTLPERLGPSYHGKLSVQGSDLVNQYGEAVQLQGVSTHGLQWFEDCYNRESLEYLVNTANINVLRISMYIALEAEGYAANKTLLDDMLRISGLCIELDLYCILDWHTLTHGDPLYYFTDEGVDVANATDFWLQMAREFKGVDNMLFELVNEPNYGSETDDRGDELWARTKEMVNYVVPLIREIDEDRIILLGTPGHCQELRYAYEDPLDEPLRHNILYTFHFYAASHTRLLESFDNYTSLVPVFVSEYGLSNYTGDGGNFLEEASQFFEIMDRKKIGSALWTYSDNHQSTGMMLPGSCYQKSWDTLQCSGIYMKNFFNTGEFFDSSAASGDDSFFESLDFKLILLFACLVIVFCCWRLDRR